MAWAGAPPAARAATGLVTSLADSGDGSLRQVLAEAAPQTTITFGVTGTITLSSGELLVDKDLTISGPGANQLALSGGLVSRVMRNSAHLTITGLSIRDGEAGVGVGGAILNAATAALTITNSVITGNRAHEGGGIYNSPGGTLLIMDSTLANNRTSLDADSNGGAIYNAAPGGAATIVGSTLSGNAVHDHGSGLYNESSATIVNSTVALNQAGTAAVASSGQLRLNNVTIVGNNGRKQANGLLALAGSLTLLNSIVAANSGGLPDCGGEISSGGHNLIGNATGCNLVVAPGDQLGNSLVLLNPKLGPLRNNGGPTATQLPLAGSPAIDTGSASMPGSGGEACEASDQRGVARPTIGASSTTCDIGAVELGEPSRLLVAGGVTQPGQPITLMASGLGDGFHYHWEFGDGSAADGNPATHTYGAAGTYTCVVTATSGALSQTARAQVRVVQGTPEPGNEYRLYLPGVTT